MNYRWCRCPVWVIGTVKGKAIRKSLDTCGWQHAEAMMLNMQPGEILAPTLARATERFLDDARRRGLSPDTIAKFPLLFKSMSALPERLRDITADDLARVAEGWKMPPVSAKK